MTRSALIAFLAAITCYFALARGTDVRAAGYLETANFVVVAPAEPTPQAGQAFAEQLAHRAELFRQRIAQTWLGDALPEGIGRAVVHIEFTDQDDVGLTWAKDDPQRAFHNVYLKTSRARGLNSTLAHEIVHVVLATEFPAPNRLAPWVEEGIASRYDDARRKSERAEILQWFARSGNWPELGLILQSPTIASNDRKSYAVAASVTDLLVQESGPTVFVQFAREARQTGWDAALRKHYRIGGIADLAQRWRQRITQHDAPAAARLAQN